MAMMYGSGVFTAYQGFAWIPVVAPILGALAGRYACMCVEFMPTLLARLDSVPRGRQPSLIL